MGIGMRLLVHIHMSPHTLLCVLVRGRMKGKEKERERNF